MLKKVAVELPKGIKKFGVPIRNMEINTFNIRQIFDLLRTHGIKKVYEYNEDETKRVLLNVRNYKDVTDFSKVEPFNTVEEHTESAEDEGIVVDANIANEELVEEVVEEETPVVDETPDEEPVEEVVEEETPDEELAEEAVEDDLPDDATEEELEAYIAKQEAMQIKPKKSKKLNNVH